MYNVINKSHEIDSSLRNTQQHVIISIQTRYSGLWVAFLKHFFQKVGVMCVLCKCICLHAVCGAYTAVCSL